MIWQISICAMLFPKHVRTNVLGKNVALLLRHTRKAKTIRSGFVLYTAISVLHLLLIFEHVNAQTSTPQPDVEQPSSSEDTLPTGDGEVRAPMVPAGPSAESSSRSIPAPEMRPHITTVPSDLAAPEDSDENFSNGEVAPVVEETPVQSEFAPNESTPLETISDRSASSLDPTASNLRGSFPTFDLPGRRKGPFFQTGSFALNASARVNIIAEDESRGSGHTEGWKFGSQLAGSIGATLGYPLTGQYLDVRYAGSYQFGGSSRSDGRFEQILNLNGIYHFAQLKLIFTGDYARSTGPDRDVGLSADRDTTAFRLTALYPLSAQSSVDVNFAESSKQYGGGIDSNELSAAFFFNRVLSLKTRVGLGGTFGALLVEGESTQPFEQVNLRITYAAAAKLNFAATIGYEWRQTDGSNSATPVFDGNITYALRTTTKLSIAASRGVSNSAALTRTNFVSSSVRAVISQRIGSTVSASLSLGYENADYDSTGNQRTTTREDNLIFVRPSLRWHLSDSLNVSSSYSFNENFSDVRSFKTQQVNLGIAYTF